LSRGRVPLAGRGTDLGRQGPSLENNIEGKGNENDKRNGSLHRMALRVRVLFAAFEQSIPEGKPIVN
jgi:hypothetical protein